MASGSWSLSISGTSLQDEEVIAQKIIAFIQDVAANNGGPTSITSCAYTSTNYSAYDLTPQEKLPTYEERNGLAPVGIVGPHA